MDKLAYSLTETAQVLGTSRPTVYALIKQPGFPVFSVGKYDLTVEMYKTFGDVVIDVFFELGNSVNKSTSASLKRWSGLCAKNQKLSVSKLTRIEDATLFEVVILGIFFTLKHIFSLTSGSKNCVATAAGI